MRKLKVFFWSRFKVETQLLSWLQKYDTEMGDKQAELDELTEKYESELSKCEELEVGPEPLFRMSLIYEIYGI